jgi:hypothetical protein
MADCTSKNPQFTSEPKLPDNVPSERYRVALLKGEHRWTFRWDPGCEAQLIDRVATLAGQSDVPLDWYDAAVICRHIAQPFSPTDRPRPAA